MEMPITRLTKSGQSGGGVKVTSNGLLQNCAVFNCAASDKGGGVYLAPGGRITGSIVYNNVGANGGGIYADDSSMVVNCTVVDNTTVNNGSRWWYIDRREADYHQFCILDERFR